MCWHSIANFFFPRDPKRARFSPKCPFWGSQRSSEGPGDQIWSQLPPIGLTGLESWLPHKTGTFGVPGGPEEARFQAKVCGNHTSNPIRRIGGSWDQIWFPGALRGPLGPPKGSLRAKTGPFGVSGDPEEARFQAKVCGNHTSNPVKPIGGSWDQIWSLGALRGPLGPPKGALRAKTSPFGVPGGPEEACYKAKVCGNHTSNPIRPIGGS